MKPTRSNEPPEIAEVDRLLGQQRYAEAAEVGHRLIARFPKLPAGYSAVARALLPTGRLARAADAADRGLRIAPSDPNLNLLKGILEHRLGQSTQAIDRLRKLLDARPSNAVEVSFALAEAMHRAGHRDALDAFVAAGGAWTSDERAAVFSARATARVDRARAIEELTLAARGARSPLLKRIAGFEAVRHLDAEGRYREAFDLAQWIHRETTPPFDLGEVEMEIAEQERLLEKGATWCPPKGPTVEGTAFVVGLPRSGTTLLEQMLDRHPAISGIGEYEGTFAIRESLIGLGFWPRNLRSLTSSDAARMASDYLEGAHARRRVG
ncbi:MAG: sulfotransferase, partial [Limnohabitans sp.]|nr:sulfotransferase [Limnohabitans sp.]